MTTPTSDGARTPAPTHHQRRVALAATLLALALLPLVFVGSWLLSDPDPYSDSGDGVVFGLILAASAAMAMFVPALRAMLRLARTPGHLRRATAVIIAAALGSSALVWITATTTDAGQWVLAIYPIVSLGALVTVDRICSHDAGSEGR